MTIGSGRFRDITGKRFTKLVVLRRSDARVIRHGKISSGVKWLCQCDCGAITSVTTRNLNSGNTESCGCIRWNSARIRGENSALNRLYCHYRISARKRSLEFEFTLDEFKQITSQNCYYCNQTPSQIAKAPTVKIEQLTYIYNGIDRLDSNLGYTLENSVPCCWRCNEGKNNISEREFYDWIKRVYFNSIERIEAKGVL